MFDFHGFSCWKVSDNIMLISVMEGCVEGDGEMGEGEVILSYCF